MKISFDSTAISSRKTSNFVCSFEDFAAVLRSIEATAAILYRRDHVQYVEVLKYHFKEDVDGVGIEVSVILHISGFKRVEDRCFELECICIHDEVTDYVTDTVRALLREVADTCTSASKQLLEAAKRV
jgi:hypothetical protein